MTIFATTSVEAVVVVSSGISLESEWAGGPIPGASRLSDGAESGLSCDGFS